ncbi:MAG: PEP-CTERM sorting domain-containing protein [Sedimentisphaerales bacterium]
MKMKLKVLCLLLVGLMATSTFAATLCSWGNADNTVGNWEVAANWKVVTPYPVPPLPTTSSGDEIKINRQGSVAIIDGISGTAYDYIQRLTLQTGVLTNPVIVRIKETGEAGSTQFGMGEFRAGASGSADQCAEVYQSGGTLTVNDLVVARSKNAIGFNTYGTYEISGGTLQARTPGAPDGRISIASFVDTAGNAGVAKFRIVGDTATINMNHLLIGSQMSNAPETAITGGDGTLEYNLTSAGTVSKITVVDTTLDKISVCLTKLVVNSTKNCPSAVDIVLVQNTGESAVDGVFDSITLSPALAGYTLSYTYNAEANGGLGERGTGNDIALIPEPATIALLTLGLIAIRRKK